MSSIESYVKSDVHAKIIFVLLRQKFVVDFFYLFLKNYSNSASYTFREAFYHHKFNVNLRTFVSNKKYLNPLKEPTLNTDLFRELNNRIKVNIVSLLGNAVIFATPRRLLVLRGGFSLTHLLLFLGVAGIGVAQQLRERL